MSLLTFDTEFAGRVTKNQDDGDFNGRSLVWNVVEFVREIQGSFNCGGLARSSPANRRHRPFQAAVAM
jgi:hypothetical protein